MNWDRDALHIIRSWRVQVCCLNFIRSELTQSCILMHVLEVSYACAFEERILEGRQDVRIADSGTEGVRGAVGLQVRI